jgi:SAM-dependent methyltransferase
MSITSKLDAWWYPNVRDKYDVEMFRSEILARLQPDMTILDYGAGRGASSLLDFKEKAAKVIGADIDPVVLNNPLVHQAVIIRDGRLEGVEDASVDLIYCSSVLEHVADPDLFFKEVKRVLKPGGMFLGKTPNRNHYMPLFAMMTPYWFHKTYNRWRGTNEVDIFPTLYRINTRGAILALCRRVGLEPRRVWSTEGRPEYLRLTPITYLAGYFYERLVNRLKLDALKGVLFLELRRPAAAHES